MVPYQAAELVHLRLRIRGAVEVAPLQKNKDIRRLQRRYYFLCKVCQG